MKRLIVDDNLELNKENLKLFADYYTLYLQNDMLKNWADRTEDKEFGGYITSFDRSWNITSFDKGAWGQCRHIYTFSYASKLLSDKQKWLDLAKCGVDFVVNKMYDKKSGRLNYLVDRSGNTVKEGTTSIFSDAFAIGGLSQYILCSGDKTEFEILNKIFDNFEINLMNDKFKFTTPYEYSEGVVYHAVNMIAINAVFLAGFVLGKERIENLLQFCLNIILNVVYDKEYGLIFEKKKNNGDFCEGANAKLINCGHILEDMWFLLEIANDRNDENLKARVIAIVENLYLLMEKSGKDLIFAYNFEGENEQKVKTWKYENTFSFSDNVSWTYAEAMCLNAFMVKNTKDQKYFTRFVRLHNYTQKYFVDSVNGDWFHALDGDNMVIQDYKGSTVKTAYHMPRAFMKTIENFKSML